MKKLFLVFMLLLSLVHTKLQSAACPQADVNQELFYSRSVFKIIAGGKFGCKEAWSSSGDYFTVGSNMHTYVHDNTGLQTAVLNADALSVEWLLSGRHFVTKKNSGEICLYDIDGTLIKNDIVNEICSIRCHPTQSYFTCGTRDTILVYDCNGNQIAHMNGNAYSVCWAPHEACLTARINGKLCICQVAENQETTVVNGNDQNVRWSPDGTCFTTGSQRSFYLYDTSGNEISNKIIGNAELVRWASTGEYLITQSQRKTYVYNNLGDEIGHLDVYENYVCWSPVGNYLTCGTDEQIYVYLVKGKTFEDFELDPVQLSNALDYVPGNANTVFWLNHTHVFVAQGNKHMCLCDASKGEVKSIEGYDSSSLRVSPTGEYFSVGTPYITYVYDVMSMEMISVFTYDAYTVNWSPRKKTFLIRGSVEGQGKRISSVFCCYQPEMHESSQVSELGKCSSQKQNSRRRSRSRSRSRERETGQQKSQPELRRGRSRSCEQDSDCASVCFW